MSESYDVELGRALKESAAKELGDWEFTPAMRAQVLERIRAEEAGQPSPASRRFNPAPVLRPLAWVAVAAAAAIVVVNVGVPRMGSSKPQATTSAPSVASTPAPVPTPPPVESASAKNDQSATGIASATEPSALAVSDPQANQVAATEPAQPAGTEPKALAEGPSPDQTAMKFAAATVAHPTVTLEMPMAAAGLSEADGAAAALEGPRGKTAGIMAAPPQNVAMASGADVVTLNMDGVQQLNADGSPAWMQPVPDLNPMGVVAVASDGRVAVSNGGNGLTILDQTGTALRTITTSAAASHLAWSADGRLASAEGSLVFVYDTNTGKPAFYVDAGINPTLAFLPDGALATFGDLPNDPALLAVTDRKGTVLLEARPTTGGHGLAFLDGGKVLVAGGQAYDRAGQPLWSAPLTTAGLAALGSEKVVAWDAHTVVVLDGRDGHVVLEAAWKGAGRGVQKVVPSADGKHVAILAQTDDGPVVWVLDIAGAVTHTEKLGATPVDLALTETHLVIMLEDSVLMRELPQ